MLNPTLNALWERAEIYNKMEETVSLLNPEEAAILTVYAENLLKTRPLRRPVKIPAALYAPYGTKTANRPESGQVQDVYERFAKSLENPESGQVSEVADTNCEFCAAGNPRLEDSRGFYHEISDCANSFWVEKCEEPANAKN